MFPSWLISALPDYDLVAWEPSDAARVGALTDPLRAAFERVPDPRRPEGVRHRLVAVLLLGVLCLLAGCKGDRAAHRWARRLPLAVRLGLGLRAGKVPARSTWADLLKEVDGDVAEVAIGAHVQVLAAQVRQELADAARPGKAPLVHAAVDGKAMKGARKKGSRHVPMLVAVFEPGTGMVLAQHPVPAGKGKGGEIGAAKRALDQISLIAGMVFSLDALHCQDATAQYFTERGAHYVISLKGNRRGLHNIVKDLPFDQIPVAGESTEKNKGRLETRTTKIIDAPKNLRFPGVARVIQVVRTRKKAGRPGPGKARTFYYLTSLAAEQASGAQLHDVIRDHWSVEVLHQIRDVLLGEDDHKVRTGALPRIWAILRNLAISLLRLAGHIHYKEAFEDNNQDPWLALKILA